MQVANLDNEQRAVFDTSLNDTWSGQNKKKARRDAMKSWATPTVINSD